jgi:retron-type reverse transcriptase
MELITTVSKTRSHGTSHRVVHSIYFHSVKDYYSRRLLHAFAADTLNECETLASMRIYEKQQRNEYMKILQILSTDTKIDTYTQR